MNMAKKKTAKKKTAKKKTAKKTKKKTAKKFPKCKKLLDESIWTVETVRSIAYSDFEKLVKKVYKVKSYSFVATEECGNDSSHRFTATHDVDQWHKDEMKEFIEEDGSVCYRNPNIFNDLVARLEIPAGEYCVNVCW